VPIVCACVKSSYSFCPAVGVSPTSASFDTLPKKRRSRYIVVTIVSGLLPFTARYFS